MPHLNAHDADSRLPCLCCDCIARAGERATVEDVEFVRAQVTVNERVLHYWLPTKLEDDREVVDERVARRLRKNLATPVPGKLRRTSFTAWLLKRG